MIHLSGEECLTVCRAEIACGGEGGGATGGGHPNVVPGKWVKIPETALLTPRQDITVRNSGLPPSLASQRAR